MLPIVDAFPPTAPFTSQLTLVVVEMVELERVMVAVNSALPLIGTSTVVGVIATDLIFVEPLLPLLPLHPAIERIPKARITKAPARRTPMPPLPSRRIVVGLQILRTAFGVSPGFLLIIARFSPWSAGGTKLFP
jgi:hypothetical protein